MSDQPTDSEWIQELSGSETTYWKEKLDPQGLLWEIPNSLIKQIEQRALDKDEHWKNAYNKLHQQYSKCVKFLEALESNTDDFDDFCDCDETESGRHDKDCRTSLLRLDFAKLWKDEQSGERR